MCMPGDCLTRKVSYMRLVSCCEGCGEVKIPDGCGAKPKEFVRILEVSAFEEAEGYALCPTDIDSYQPVATLLANPVHQHFVADIAFEVRTNRTNRGIDIYYQRCKCVINGGQKRVARGDIHFRTDWHAGGFTTAGWPSTFMMESPYGYDS